MDSDRRSARDRQTPSARRLELLRARRTSQTPDRSLKAALAPVESQLRRTQTSASPISALWSELVPSQLARATSVRLDRGTLVVSVADSSSRFALDRLLRAGVERELVRRSPVAIRGVRLVSMDSRRPPAGGPPSTTRSTSSRSS